MAVVVVFEVKNFWEAGSSPFLFMPGAVAALVVQEEMDSGSHSWIVSGPGCKEPHYGPGGL